MNIEKNKTLETHIEHCEKKAYIAPSLHEIGKIAEKTQAGGQSFTLDNGNTNEFYKS